MDFSELTKAIYNRIQEREPENVTKIVGYLLLQGYSDQEMAQLAYGPDNLIKELIFKAKAELHRLSRKSPVSPISLSLNTNPVPVSDFSSQSTPFSPVSSRPVLSPTTTRGPSSYWDHQFTNKQTLEYTPIGYSDPVCELQNQAQLLSLHELVEPISSELSGEYGYQGASFGNLQPRTGHRYPGAHEFPVKTCHYYSKGFCKHGSNCRFFHGQGQCIPEGTLCPGLNDLAYEDQIFLPGSLEKLEFEIIEILKARAGNPISIASLPMIYYEKYGKVLQAEGYLTESQRHGKAGYSLTKLLARLGHNIRLIDRPHGQHAIILAEDAAKYTEIRHERSDPGPIVSGSRQIYLTFPAESTFTEGDVANYFSTFGVVEDVRIPCQQKRMFGFVTFASAETVKTVLGQGNPHFVCGSRVLVKPYREKAKLLERKYVERSDPLQYHFSHFTDTEAEIRSMPRGYSSPRMHRKKLLEEQEQALETSRLAELQLARKTPANQYYLLSSTDMKGISEGSVDHLDFPLTEQFSYLLDVVDDSSTSDEKTGYTATTFNGKESAGLDLPDNPFASAVARSTYQAI